MRKPEYNRDRRQMVSESTAFGWLLSDYLIMSSLGPWIWKGVFASLQSGRYALLYPRLRCAVVLFQVLWAAPWPHPLTLWRWGSRPRGRDRCGAIPARRRRLSTSTGNPGPADSTWVWSPPSRGPPFSQPHSYEYYYAGIGVTAAIMTVQSANPRDLLIHNL